MPSAVVTAPQVLADTQPRFSAKRQVQKKSLESQSLVPLKEAPRDENGVKKTPPRSGQPIINWFQRKLAGTVRTRRERNERPVGGHHMTAAAVTPHLTASTTARSNGRSVSSPLPHGAVAPQRHGTSVSRRGRRTISLNDSIANNVDIHEDNVDALTGSSSLARDSMWSPVSVLEADEDASLRPLPPSAPPSPSLSHSSSSYLSNSRTFRSIAASTKPTTVLSIDLPPAGIGHIAQVQPTLAQPRHGPHSRSQSTNTSPVNGGSSIMFSTLPPFTQSMPSGTAQGTPLCGLQVPLHTTHHPRNNPRPWSPPPDNASILTLASSAFAFPAARMTVGSMASTALSGPHGGADSISHLGGSVTGDPEGENLSQFLLGDDDRLDMDAERDADASMRALRPRSSRRPSWDSEVSGWSAGVTGFGVGNSIGTKSLWTTYSLKTGEPRSPEDEETEESGEGEHDEESSQEEPSATNTTCETNSLHNDSSQPEVKSVETGLPHLGKVAAS